MTYAQALAQYHLRPESKFLNGDYCDRGRTDRRHVIAAQIVHIGKESNKWEEQYFGGDDDDEAPKLNMVLMKAQAPWMRRYGACARRSGNGRQRNS
jgi:hypothetical protein